MASTFSKIFNYCITFLLIAFGILFVMAAPVDPTTSVTRLITGVVLIVAGIVFFAVFSLVIERRKYKVVKVKEQQNGEKKKYYPKEIICKNCKQKTEITDLLKEQIKEKETIYCENCGQSIVLDNLDVNW